MARVLQYFLMFAGSSREAWKTDLLQWNKRPYGPNISLDEMAMDRDGPNMFTPHKISPVNPWMIWVRDYRLMTFFLKTMPVIFGLIIKLAHVYWMGD